MLTGEMGRADNSCRANTVPGQAELELMDHLYNLLLEIGAARPQHVPEGRKHCLTGQQ